MANAQGKKMTLKVVDCKPVYHGVNGKGDAYTIHEVKATKPDGSLVNEKLRSFSALPVGQPIEVTVVPFVSEKHGRSFTLYPTGAKATGTTAAVNDLGETVEQMRGMIAALVTRVDALEKQVGRGATPPPAAPTQSTAALDAQFGAEAPY